MGIPEKLREVLKKDGVGAVATNEPLTYMWTATLKKGTYAYRVLATEAAGHVADPAGSAALRIK